VPPGSTGPSGSVQPVGMAHNSGGAPGLPQGASIDPRGGSFTFQFRKDSSTLQEETHGESSYAALRPSLERALRHVQSQPGLAPATPGFLASPCSGSPSSGPPQQLSVAPQAMESGTLPVRGRQAILQKMKQVAFGVSSPRTWSSQLEECELLCKNDVLQVVASCRALGHTFTDQDFPPSKQSLFINGEKPSSSSKMPKEVVWRRASELCPMDRNSGAWTLSVATDSRLIPGAINDTAFLGVVALLRTAQPTPDELIVHYDLVTGVVGVRLFKDGEWTYEVIDDHLPCCNNGLACGRSVASGEVWIALLEKANAKIHGSYEAVQRSTELETIEDLTGGAVRKLDRREVAAATELVRVLRSRQQLGCLHMAARRRERRGEEHSCGLLSGHAYPIVEAEQPPGNAGSGCRLENPWLRGSYRGMGADRAPGPRRDGSNAAEGAPYFDMDAADLLEHFTEVIELRSPPPSWQCYQVTLSTDRPSYPLLSARSNTQCLLIANQPDRRWKRQDSYLNGLGLRVYRCRVRPLPVDKQGARQDPKANPFEPLELIRRRPLGKTRSACVEFGMEPYSLYIVSADSQYRCPRCVLRFACSTEVQFRELSAPEAGHFLAAQRGAAQPAAGLGPPSPARSTSDASAFSEANGEEYCMARELAARRCGLGATCEAPGFGGSHWWTFGCY